MSRLLVVLSLFALGACVRLSEEPADWRCSAHSECPGGMRCMSELNVCVEGDYCYYSADCLDGEVCSGNRCSPPECSEAYDPTCGAYTCHVADGVCFVYCEPPGEEDYYSESDDQALCKPGYHCDEAGECQLDCTGDEDCDASEVCEDGTCMGRSCTGDADCGSYACGDDDRCLTRCTDAYDCSLGARCDEADSLCKSCDEECAPYACDEVYEDLCLYACDTDADCATGFDCDRQTGECVDPGHCADELCGGFACSGDVCAVRCEDDADCAPGHECYSLTGECRPACEADCAPFGCTQDGSCRTSCSEDGDCAAEYRCDTLLAECVSPDYGGCVDSDCAPYRCDGTGSCLVSCSTSDDCHPSHGCDYDYYTCL
jgi:hypothetical protein